MFNWKLKATNAIYLEDANGQEGRPFKSRFLQPGLVKYDFGVCLLKKETIDKFINTFLENPVIIDHMDNIDSTDVCGTITKVWFSADDGWFWCSGMLTSPKAIELIENGYNVSCQYRITDYADNDEDKLHNANPYDKEILDGVFEHLAIVENPRYEDAFIAVNAYIACNDKWITVKPNGEENKGRPLLLKDGETVKEAMQRQWGIYDKRQAQDNHSSQSLSLRSQVDNLIKEYFSKIKDLSEDQKDKYKKKIKELFNKIEEEKQKEEVHSYGKRMREEAKRIKEREAETEKEYHNLNGFEKNLTPLERGKAEKFLNSDTYIRDENGNIKALTQKEFIIDSLKEGYKPVERENKGKKEYVLSKPMKDYNSTFKINKISYDFAIYIENKKASNSIKNFNPNTTISKGTNKYNKVFDYIRNTKGESMDNETKGLFSALLDALKARNEADDDEEKDKEGEKATNEDVDKRKLIDEVGGILKGEVDEELWRTIIGKIEKIAYDKSEAGTADNKAKNADEGEDKKDEAKNKCRNEDVDKRDLIRQIMAIAGKHEDNEDVRTIAKLAEKLAYDKSEAGTADNKCKNSDEEKLYEELKEEVEKEAENKKASNSLDALVNKLYSAVSAEYEPSYISPEKGIELGELIYGRK